MSLRRLLLALLGLALATPAAALPRMSLTAGSRCSNCHVNPQGSGLRSDLGWYSMNQTAMVTWDKLGLHGLHEIEDNVLADRVTVGFDIRGVSARLGRPNYGGSDGKTVVKPEYQSVPMQFSPGVNVAITDTVSVAGSVNAFAFERRYNGQPYFDAWLRWAPDIALPSVRAGMLQPSFGIRHDDHTLLLRSNPATRQPILPPAYADPGIELAWEGVHWLSAELGGFWPKNLAEADATVADDAPMFNARVTFWPRSEEQGINTWIGGSILATLPDERGGKAYGMQLHGVHAGIGKAYWGSLVAEAVHGITDSGRDSLALMVQASWPIYEWLVLEARAERATVDQDDTRTARVHQYVAGLQWFPLPFIELRPEYRYVDTLEYTFAHWTLQTHVFF